ncbi:hypothetical protein Esi_0056_0033 [Ectocarpus siliculosus]|uniref:Uncharacterized protein n=1 Tax=Ectocarpus siliculosus TaxID=2880 RepID=D8LPX3_ECTSI|nr:hypothetical protein Esi_0056_0033 [Ectocarpus siliculosus]|eukprot:CBN74865.1 hypothetical protein Esi_0056_0033 [Ectocarpus siliculosus]
MRQEAQGLAGEDLLARRVQIRQEAQGLAGERAFPKNWNSTRRVATEAREQEAPTHNVGTAETSSTLSSHKPIPLAGYEQMSNYTRPVVEDVKPWCDGSVMVVVDNCGNCYSSSWFLIVILWAVQSPGRLRDLMGKLQDGCLEGGALFDIPLPYQGYVKAVCDLIEALQERWEERTRFAKDDDRDYHGVQEAVGLVKMLKKVPGSATTPAAGGTNEETMGLQLKRGIAIVARAFDVWWASRNEFSEMHIVATLHRSMEFDVGLQIATNNSAREAGGEPHPSSSASSSTAAPDTMRPACSLGYIVGMAMESIDTDRNVNRTDLMNIFDGVAEAARVDHIHIDGMDVWKDSCPHYNVRVKAGPLANALAVEYGLDLGEGDAVAFSWLEKGHRWQEENSIGIGDFIRSEELKELEKLERERDANKAENQPTSGAAAAAAPSPASNGNTARWPLLNRQTNTEIASDELVARALASHINQEFLLKEKQQVQADEEYARSLVSAQPTEQQASQAAQKRGSAEEDGEGWQTVRRPKNRQNQSRTKPRQQPPRQPP